MLNETFLRNKDLVLSGLSDKKEIQETNLTTEEAKERELVSREIQVPSKKLNSFFLYILFY